MTSAHSNFLDSDSDSRHSYSSDSSDDNLPAYNVCTPEKKQRLSSSSGVTASISSKASTSPGSATTHQQKICSTPTKKLNFPAHHDDQSYFHGTSPKRSLKLIGSPAVGEVILSPSRNNGASHFRDFMGSPVRSPKTLSGFSVGSPPARLPTLSASPSGSPLHLVERHEKTLHQHSRLTKRVESLTETIKSKMERTTKLEEFREAGGIRGLAKDLERRETCSVSSDGEEELKPLIGFRSRQQLKEDDKFFLPLHAPGMPVLVCPARLMSTLNLPSKESETQLKDLCTRGDQVAEWEETGFLRHYVCDYWPAKQYLSRPCPMFMWDWLFEVACLCCDVLVSKAALSNLNSLLEVAGDKGHSTWPVLVPGPLEVLRILEALGADRSKLHLESVIGTESKSSVEVCSPSVLAGMTHLFHYLNLALQCRPSVLCAEDIVHVAVQIATLSLDSILLEMNNVELMRVMSDSLCSLLTVIPDSSWPQCRDSLINKLSVLSSHHHDCFHICDFLVPSSPRSEELCRLIIRHFLEALFHLKDEQSCVLKDSEFAWRLVKFYHDKHSSTYDYYSMYSGMCMLSMLMALSKGMDWPTKQEAEIKSMLSDLGLVRIRDNTDKTERVPVKQLLIYYKLEMDTRKRKKSLGQMNLLDAYNT